MKLFRCFFSSLLNNTAFSLASMTIAMGMLGGLSLAVTEMMKRIHQGKREVSSIQDQFSVQKEVALLLSKEKHCKASLIWKSSDTSLGTTASFLKSSIDNYGGGESRKVELWTGRDDRGTRGERKFFDGQDYGKVVVKSIRLSLDPSTGTLPVSATNYRDLGNLHIVVTKTVNNKKRDMAITVPMEIEVLTDSSRRATIISCQSSASASKIEHFEATEDHTYAGVDAGKSNTNGAHNTFLGANSGKRNTEGTNNTFLGHHSGQKNTRGSNNSFLGYQSGARNTTGAGNTMLGGQSGFKNTTGDGNVFLGFQSGYNNTVGTQNTFVGGLSGMSNSTGKFNIFIGYSSGAGVTTGSSNIFIGRQAGYTHPTTRRSIFIGDISGAQSKGYDNIFLGHVTGYKTQGRANVFIGNSSGQLNTSGSNNVFLGKSSGNANTTGNSNTYLGTWSGSTNTTGKENTFVGSESGTRNQTASHNLFMGFQSGSQNTTGQQNTFLGTLSGQANVQGEKNTFVGYKSAATNSTGSSNICIGWQSCNTGSTNTASDRIVIGINHNTNAVISDYQKPGNPGDGSIVLGKPDSPDFWKRRHALAINNIIEGDFAKKWVLIKDDLTVKRDLAVKRNIQVDGRIEAPHVLAQVSTPSDGRMKNVLEELTPEKSMEKLLALQGIRYNYTKETLPQGEHLGFDAQEVEKVVPEVVRTQGEKKMLSLNYQGLVPLIVEAMKKLQEENWELKERIKKLEEKE